MGDPVGGGLVVEEAGSGRAGGTGCRERRCRRGRGEDLEEGERGPIEDFDHQAGVVAAVFLDEGFQFPPQRMVRADAKITADICDDGADGLAADLGSDLLGRGERERREIGTELPVAGRARRGRAARGCGGRGGGLRRCVEAGGVVVDLVLKRLGAKQATGDAC